MGWAPRALLGLTALLLVLPSGFAALSVQQTVAASPTAFVPVTLAAGAVGTASIGASGTSASVTYLVLGASAQLLKVVEGSGTPAWNVQVKALSVTGLGPLDTVTVVLKLGTTTQTQVVASGASGITQAIGTAVTLPVSGGPVQVLASGGVAAGLAIATLQVVLTPAAGGTMVITYPLTFTLG